MDTEIKENLTRKEAEDVFKKWKQKYPHQFIRVEKDDRIIKRHIPCMKIGSCFKEVTSFKKQIRKKPNLN